MTKKAVFVIVAASLCPGCGATGLVNGQGKVTLDGEPIAGASVTFAPIGEGGELCSAVTDADGHFSLATRNNPGMHSGRYKVIVIKQEQVALPKAKKSGPGPGKERMNAPKSGKSLLPEIYSDARTTPLELEVPPGGSKDLKVELTSNAK